MLGYGAGVTVWYVTGRVIGGLSGVGLSPRSVHVAMSAPLKMEDISILVFNLLITPGGNKAGEPIGLCGASFAYVSIKY